MEALHPRFKLMQLCECESGRSWKKKKSSHAQQTNQCCCPSNSPSAVSSCLFHASDLCCCCFLLWAEFYTVCQSPERHTLEGPVEWDTKSDPSGEQLLSHPTVFVSLYLPSSLLLPSSFFPPAAYPSLFLRPVLFLRLHQQLPRLLAKFERVRSPLFGEATLHLLTRSVLEWSAKPSQHLPACITASVQLMNMTEGMCLRLVPCLFVL